jgi:hypothetical protein
VSALRPHAPRGARRDDPLHSAEIGGENGATRADRRQHRLQDAVEPTLQRDIAQAAAAISCTQTRDLRNVWIERVEIGKHDIALCLAGIGNAQVPGIGVHRLHGARDLIGRRRQTDRVAERLRRLRRTVNPGQARHARKQRLRLGQHHAPRQMIDLGDNLVRLLDHRQLIVTDRHQRRPERSDIGRLRDGIAEEARWNVARKTSRLNLGLNRRIALEPRNGREIEIEHRQLGEFRHTRLQYEWRAFWIEPDRKIVERNLHNIARDARGIARIVRQRLQIGEQDELPPDLRLQRQPVHKRSGIVPQMQRPRRPVARQNDVVRIVRHCPLPSCGRTHRTEKTT